MSIAVGVLGVAAIFVGIVGAIWRWSGRKTSGDSRPISPLLVSAGAVVIFFAVQLYVRDH